MFSFSELELTKCILKCWCRGASNRIWDCHVPDRDWNESTNSASSQKTPLENYWKLFPSDRLALSLSQPGWGSSWGKAARKWEFLKLLMVWLEKWRATMLDISWIKSLNIIIIVINRAQRALGMKEAPLSCGASALPNQNVAGWMRGESGYRQIRQGSLGVFRWLTIL